MMIIKKDVIARSTENKSQEENNDYSQVSKNRYLFERVTLIGDLNSKIELNGLQTTLRTIEMNIFTFGQRGNLLETNGSE